MQMTNNLDGMCWSSYLPVQVLMILLYLEVVCVSGCVFHWSRIQLTLHKEHNCFPCLSFRNK
uniref:Uncharacterized protein n=1 Tax=Lepeophtheirus salmonis TaxID=72036 RepID=A0A0K2TBR5_LEPSM